MPKNKKEKIPFISLFTLTTTINEPLRSRALDWLSTKAQSQEALASQKDILYKFCDELVNTETFKLSDCFVTVGLYNHLSRDIFTSTLKVPQGPTFTSQGHGKDNVVEKVKYCYL